MSTYISPELRQLVGERARECCEYCLLHQNDTDFTHPIDHIISVKHKGKTVSENLALACMKCNRHKGSDIAAIDPMDNTVVRLYNPRTQNWSEHFALDGARIIGLTPEGRVTVDLLQMNDRSRLTERRRLIALGRYPTSIL